MGSKGNKAEAKAEAEEEKVEGRRGELEEVRLLRLSLPASGRCPPFGQNQEAEKAEKLGMRLAPPLMLQRHAVAKA